MILHDWAQQWGIPSDAIYDLCLRMGIQMRDCTPYPQEAPEGSEARQQSLVRLDAGRQGVWLTRNNVGALIDTRGVPVRYGLANESQAQNKVVKSADLIGIRPILIGPQHVGKVIGQFVSREVKHAGWKYRGDAHEVAQHNWANFVVSRGGDASFCTGPGTFK